MIEKEYLANKITQANDAQLVAILFEAFIDALNDAIAQVKNKDEKQLNKSTQKARSIIAELLATVQGDTEIALNLKSLYVYLNKLVTEAEIEKDVNKFEQAIKIATPQLEAWTELGEKEVTATTETIKPKGPAIVAGMTYGKGQLNDHVMNDGDRWEKG
ncbi:flagellar export chaperone FliS [Serpentinicella sp. ANB-PHB4]|uniref:flagellar export chaperone FliS n=1 Tax=Serpentinicella sp. ANB-PHB4 TaxID=3074076 RepID=UPI00285A2532|nr:flagellar export chaperone FliS [Serpentinicella sp. ANB-PHB4]MDR5659806.1 flagellar export chaperone FliS [Serpentinicella sp. ANB-PHB4]